MTKRWQSKTGEWRRQVGKDRDIGGKAGFE